MPKIEPRIYKEMLAGIQLNEIRLLKLNSILFEDQFKSIVKVNIKTDATFTNNENGFIVENKYVLSCKNKERKVGLKIDCVYSIKFESSCEITQDFFDVYKKISLPVNVWPFFRELVNSLTSRMNIPPLTLPLFKQ